MDIQCIVVDPVSGRVSLALGSKILTGMQKLVQIVILSLLNIPGKDVLDPASGGGLPAMIGENFDPNDKAELYSEVVRRVAASESQVLASQIGLTLPAAEQLAKLQVVNIKNAVNSDSADVTLRITNEAGANTNVVL